MFNDALRTQLQKLLPTLRDHILQRENDRRPVAHPDFRVNLQAKGSDL